jgi:hypothetical protein
MSLHFLFYCWEFALHVESFFPPYYHSTVTVNKETQYKSNQMQGKKPNAKKTYEITQSKEASSVISHYLEPRFTFSDGG